LEEHVASVVRVEEKKQHGAGSKQLFVSRFILLSCLYYFSTMEMDTRAFETTVVFQLTTWHYIPADKTFHNHCCENLISYNVWMLNFVDRNQR
jgi:hypothetical protein